MTVIVLFTEPALTVNRPERSRSSLASAFTVTVASFPEPPLTGVTVNQSIPDLDTDQVLVEETVNVAFSDPS